MLKHFVPAGVVLRLLLSVLHANQLFVKRRLDMNFAALIMTYFAGCVLRRKTRSVLP
jgi:hypothetical protein